MKILILTASLVGMFSVSQGIAGAPVGANVFKETSEIQHSGGCRKSSPAGQCCHAGSKPYHCH